MPGPNELGDFLRTRRAKLRPGDVCLPPGHGSRRTPGLRREEIAALAGLSIDYYIRLEQGKEANPSGPILDGLARALRLNEEENTHLYALANHAAGRTARGSLPASRVVRPGVRQLLEAVRPCPAYVLTRTSDLLAANPEALVLFLAWRTGRPSGATRSGTRSSTRRPGSCSPTGIVPPRRSPPTCARSPRTHPTTRTSRR